jgi:hypothetical protein
MVRKLSDPLYDDETGLKKGKVRRYYQPYGQSVPASKLGGVSMAKKKPPVQMFDARLGKPVLLIARVPGCSILTGLKNKPLSERQMNKVVRGIVALCKKHGVDRVCLGMQICRLGRKITGRMKTWRV